MSSKDGSIVLKSISRRVSAQEATIEQDEPHQSQYECPICIYWLNEPVLTSCGHRFCKKCITSWLRKPNPCCPIDNHPLSENDLFPDNYTRREIEQIRLTCANLAHGCSVVVSPLNMDDHLAQCAHRPAATTTAAASAASLLECTFKQCGCAFATADATQLNAHLSAEMVMHLNLFMASYTHAASTPPGDNNGLPNSSSTPTMESTAVAQHAWDAPNKLTNGGSQHNHVQHADNCAAVALATTSQAAAAAAASTTVHRTQQPPPVVAENTTMLKALYERIVVLEQQSRAKDSQLERLTQQIARITLQHPTADAADDGADVPSAINPRYSGGVLVWRIGQFQSKVAAMSADPNAMFYSGESYTSPHGYRYCVRINVSPKFRDFVGLHVHLMQSDNDRHLEWPFRGRIKISMIHPNMQETKNDIIMSKPEIMAFHRPAQEVSPRGFGFLEYASISHVLSRGFVVDDALTVKVQLSIV